MSYEVFEIKKFLITLEEKTHPGFTYLWNWEISLARNSDGKYQGSAKEERRSHMVINWTNIEAADEKDALDHMVNLCKNKMP